MFEIAAGDFVGPDTGPLSIKIFGKSGPVEGGAGICFTPRGNVTVTSNGVVSDLRVGPAQRDNQARQAHVLCLVVSLVIATFELDANRKIVTHRFTAPL